MESYNMPFNENYFKRRGKGSSHTEEYRYNLKILFSVALLKTSLSTNTDLQSLQLKILNR